MYQITIDNDGVRQILHTDDPDSTQRITAGKLKEYVGTTPSIALTVTPQNACYDMLTDRCTCIELKNTETGEPEFEGYLLKSPESMTSGGLIQKKLTCEGYMGYLNDSVQMYHHYEDKTPAEFLQAVLDCHNATTEAHKHIYLGTVNISGNTNSKTTAYRSTLAEIKENLVDRLGGELRVRRGEDGRLLLDYLSAAQNGSTSDTIIELGHNLKSLTVESDTTGIITRLIPLGFQTTADTAERLTIVGAVDPDDGHTYEVPYIDDPDAIAKYGVIVGTAEFDDITVPENLVARGKAYLAENNRVKKHYSASVLDLSGKGSIRCGNTYRFRHRLMGLDEHLRLLGRTVDILKPYTPQVEIGDKTTKISGVTAQNRKMIDYEIPKQISQTVQTAKDIASSMIRAATTGYVVIRPNEILIMDTDDAETATSVWRWNAGGLGYSHSDTPGAAYNGEYGLAMTMNGQIVADFIAAGTMYADRIRGGTLKLGGDSNINGEITVVDDAGQELFHVDQNGLKSVNPENQFWLRIASGILEGGIGTTRYSQIDSHATVYDEDADVTRHGLDLISDVVYFTTDLIAINGKSGGTGRIHFLTGISAPSSVVTDVYLDEDGALQVERADISSSWQEIAFEKGIMYSRL